MSPVYTLNRRKHQIALAFNMSASDTKTWKPPVDGELKARCLQVVDEIAAQLPSAADPLADEYSLAGGRSGLAVAFSYFHQHLPNHGFDATASEHLGKAIDRMVEEPLPPGLYDGFTGIAWAVAHLNRIAGQENDSEEFEAIDDGLLEMLSVPRWTQEYDLVGGLVGLGVFCLQRLPDPKAMECLRRIVAQLTQLVEQQPSGVAWRTPVELLPAHRQATRPQGELNLGLAHGVPGVIALLAESAAAGMETESSAKLVEAAVRWLLAQRQLNSPYAQFGYDAEADDSYGSARTAWCYGDPGVAAALLCAARSLKKPEWEQVAVDLALSAAKRPEEEMEVRDAGLCHGWAGLMHIYNRLYQATGEEPLADFARHCCTRTLEGRMPGRGIAGYAAWHSAADPNVQWEWKTEAGFLEGAAGIALALLAATTPIRPDWDHVLLISNRATA
jgi:lantibiotic biosynthesis protein